MSTDCNKVDTNIILMINRRPRDKWADLIVLEKDVCAAAVTRALSKSVLKTTTTRELSIGPHGTYVTLDVPPMLQYMNCGGTDALTTLIKPLNSWLQRRVHVVMSEPDPSPLLAALDAELDAYGFVSLRDTLLKLAGSNERRILIEDPFGNGGLLVLPPRAHLIAPRRDSLPEPNEGESQRVLRIEKITELTTASGCCHMIPSDAVSSDIHAGVTARLGHPRAGCVNWQPVFGVRRIHSPEEN